MKVFYISSFLKDIKKINDPTFLLEIKDVLDMLIQSENLSEIHGVKKLKGHKSAYRIKIKEFRIGLYFTNNEVKLVRILNRKDIYKYFPYI